MDSGNYQSKIQFRGSKATSRLLELVKDQQANKSLKPQELKKQIISSQQPELDSYFINQKYSRRVLLPSTSQRSNYKLFYQESLLVQQKFITRTKKSFLDQQKSLQATQVQFLQNMASFRPSSRDTSHLIKGSQVWNKDLIHFRIDQRKVNEGYCTTRLMGRFLTPKDMTQFSKNKSTKDINQQVSQIAKLQTSEIKGKLRFANFFLNSKLERDSKIQLCEQLIRTSQGQKKQFMVRFLKTFKKSDNDED